MENNMKVGLRQEMQRGTLLWVNTDNLKVYRSSIRFDTALFHDHDSHYMGDWEDVFDLSSEQRDYFRKLYGQAERIYGVCLQKEGFASEIDISAFGEKAMLFTTWEDMQDFANDHFPEADAAIKRREETHDKWLERGREYVRRQQEAKQE